MPSLRYLVVVVHLLAYLVQLMEVDIGLEESLLMSARFLESKAPFALFEGLGFNLVLLLVHVPQTDHGVYTALAGNHLRYSDAS